MNRQMHDWGSGWQDGATVMHYAVIGGVMTFSSIVLAAFRSVVTMKQWHSSNVIVMS